MPNSENLFSPFTNQYSLSKTLRFGLKPQGKTAEWIEKHDIIGVKEDKLIGKDATKAKHYKYAKKLLDNMHRIFIEDALKQLDNEELQNKLKIQLHFISTEEDYELESDKETANIFNDILDYTANQWISQFAEEMPKFWAQDITDLKQKIEKETNKKKLKGYKSAVNSIEKKIKNPLKDIKKNGIATLYSNIEAMHLLEWKVLTEKVTATFKDLGQGDSTVIVPSNIIYEYLHSFRKFYTYFTGFNENRQNVYDTSGKKSTSIFNRTFKDNFFFHLANISKWNTIQNSIKKQKDSLTASNFFWEKELTLLENNFGCSINELMTVASFTQFMNQSGIDQYNKIIGGLPALDGSKKVQGLNEIINLCRQKVGAKRAQFPPMKEFYKQILSKSDKTFIPEFSDDEDMLKAVKSFHTDMFVENNILKEFILETTELSTELNENLDTIYLAKDKVSRISNLITGQWNIINSILLEQLGEKTFHKRTYFSFAEIEQAIADGLKAELFQLENNFQGLVPCFVEHVKQSIAKIEKTWQELVDNGVLQQKKINTNRSISEEVGFKQIAVIKDFLDTSRATASFVRDWHETREIQKIETRNKHWYQHLLTFSDTFNVIGIYNMVRNHVTKKPSATEKLKITFENATLLDGWDRNKEPNNHGVLLQKDNNFYLAIMTKDSNHTFDYAEDPSDSKKKEQVKTKLREVALTTDKEKCYQKVNYKLLPGANKMLPKVFFAKSNIQLFSPSTEIINIKENKLYSKAKIEKHGINNLHKYIDFCKQSLQKHPDWSRSFGFTSDSFTQTEKYTSIDQFYREVELLGYSITFDQLSEDYINEKVEKGELYLFQIYNKDFSQNKKSKGTDNLHTIYWKGLFAPENLKNTVLKLNGQAEIFFRQASIKYSKEKMKTGHHAEELKGKFSYPIIKNKRFTTHKFFFHCPITINFGAPSLPTKFNSKIRTFLKNNKDVNIIGIDRGEKHLLYYSIINQNGKIIEQGSLNEISNGFIPRGEKKEKSVNYHAKLDQMEKERDAARKSWSTIENIKEMKAGYLSQVVHKLSELIIKHNAIVVLEDLNIGFKRGRFGVEKQVYQKFEKALIDKLNYLVFKKESPKNCGSYLNAYQLTNKFTSFKEMGKQTGILFYTTASYTSTTDPVTGFLKNVYPKYQSVLKSIDFWKSFDSIIYNPTKDRFEFTYTLGKVANKSMYKEKGENESQLQKRTWTVCSCVTRSRYIKAQVTQTEAQKQNTTGEQIGNKGRHETFIATAKIKEILNKAQIDYSQNNDIKAELIQQTQKEIHSSMIYAFNAIMTMRVTDSSAEKGTKENDFILSPVEPFFDSRNATKDQPENGDANGAYNIARKGICILNNINQSDDVNEANIAISKQEWQNYAQQ